MDTTKSLFGGIFGVFVVSCGAMVLIPNSQIGDLNPVTPDWDGSQLGVPAAYPTETRQIGRTTFAANGCFYCHSQQVRDPQYGPDMERGWGVRRTVARDYIFEDVPYLGSCRIGPDLANYGSKTWRNEPIDDPKKPARRDGAWLFRHMYAPNSVVPDSLCPPLPFLFVREEIGGALSPDAVHSEGRYQWLPTAEARNLAAYILGQDRSFPLPGEAPTIIKPQEEKK
jgi:cytochrome c oxidase cbb3-type subunit II